MKNELLEKLESIIIYFFLYSLLIFLLKGEGIFLLQCFLWGLDVTLLEEINYRVFIKKLQNEKRI